MPRTLQRSLNRKNCSTLITRSLLPILCGIVLLFEPHILHRGSSTLSRMVPSPLVEVFGVGEPVTLIDFIGFETQRVRKSVLREVVDGIIPVDSRTKRRRKFFSREFARRDISAGNYGDWDYGAGKGSMLVPRVVLEDKRVKRLLVGGGRSADGGPRWLFCEVGEVGRVIRKELGENVRLGDLSVRDRERWLTGDDIVRWMVIKDPWVRTVQFWLKGIRNALDSKEYRRFMSAVRGRNLTDTESEVQRVSLSMYFLLLASQSTQNLDENVMPTVHLCAWKDVRYSLLIRWESAADDLRIAGKKLKRSFIKSAEYLRSEQQHWHREQRFLKRANLRKCKLRASKLYKEDLEAFGYPAEPVINPAAF